MSYVAYPSFATPITSAVTVTDMDTVRFNCKGNGMPEVTYEWFYENEIGKLLRINHLLVDCNCCGIGRFNIMDFFMEREYEIGVEEETGINYLSFAGATADNEGTYICKITTQLGTAESTFTLVVVNEPGKTCVVIMYIPSECMCILAYAIYVTL